MKNILFLMIIAAIGYKGWGYLQAESVKPLYDQPYLVVYGRDSCGYTMRTVKALSEAGIKFQYLKIDDKTVANSLNSRMEAMGIDTRHYYLPVVDLNNSIIIRPDNANITIEAKKLAL